MREGAGRRPLTGIPLAIGGIVAGHALAYVLAYPIRAVRDARLEETGHEGFPLLLLAGLLGTGAAIVWLGLRSIRRATGAPSATMLLSLQVPAFAFLELAERGFDVAAFGRDPAVALGLLLQVVFALVIAAIARGAVIAGVWFGRSAPRPSRTPRPAVLPRLAEPAAPDPLAFGLRRAPPGPSLV
ncbi:MAG TPA: hypothetical protein VJ913_06150 [Actinomycetota bacterium]|nr:hypothetical protein [Actinomycetota bacterium]